MDLLSEETTDQVRSTCSGCSYMSSSSSEESLNSIEDTTLPIEEHKDAIIDMVRNNQFVIVHGKTGCGKTTQLPQYLLDAGLNNKCMIGVTQPRRISAVSMATRVAKERQCQLGTEVGYQIRFDKKLNASTKIKYMTEGILINECKVDTRLNDYGVIIVDEAHEKSINNAIILGLLKIIARNRPDIRIVVASATISCEKFSVYFNNANILSIPGMIHPVEIIYLKKSVKDVIDDAVRKIKMIHSGKEEGGILVFLPGEDEINHCCDEIEDLDNLVVLPFYAAIGLDAQKEVFKPVESHQRKVVVATNIGETSITIPGIRFVIDSGSFKQSNFIPRLEIDTLEPTVISKAQADQRKGRAGRTSSGWCYRLYTESQFKYFRDDEEPEIYRSNLSSLLLTLISMEHDPYSFEFLDKPEHEEMKRSEQELIVLGLLDSDCRITQLGRSVSNLPMDPVLGKLVITSVNDPCFVDILSVAVMLPENYIFKRPRKNKEKALEKQKKLFDADGDHFTLLNVYKLFKATDHVKHWCHKNYINHHVMEGIQLGYSQIIQILQKNNLTFTDTSTGDRELIKMAFVKSYYKNICTFFRPNEYIRLYKHLNISIHSFSSLWNNDHPMVLVYRIVRTGRRYVYTAMKINIDNITNLTDELHYIGYKIKELQIVSLDK